MAFGGPLGGRASGDTLTALGRYISMVGTNIRAQVNLMLNLMLVVLGKTLSIGNALRACTMEMLSMDARVIILVVMA
jgi:hypothetical protein